MNSRSMVHLKRHGPSLSRGAIREFISGTVSGTWTTERVGAFLKALSQRELSLEEVRWLLEEMIQFGEILDLRTVAAPKVDRHSTGGTGDQVPLVLAPLAAACGLAVPMICSNPTDRNIGLPDKLASIPGFRISLSNREIRDQVDRIGCVVARRADSRIPADKILHAIRGEGSATGYPPLIAASILSRKFAEGLDALLLEVPFGRGANFERPEDAETIADLMLDLGHSGGCRMAAWLTNLDTPLGGAVGGAVEVEEGIAVLNGQGPVALGEFICEQVAELLVLGGLAKSREDGLEVSRGKLRNGSALERFSQMVEAQGGDPGAVEDPRKLFQDGHVREITCEASEPSWVADVDARQVAEIALETGAGCRKPEEPANPLGGVSALVGVGDRVEPGDILGRLHFSTPSPADEWARKLKNAITFSGEPVRPRSRIFKKLR